MQWGKGQRDPRGSPGHLLRGEAEQVDAPEALRAQQQKGAVAAAGGVARTSQRQALQLGRGRSQGSRAAPRRRPSRLT